MRKCSFAQNSKTAFAFFLISVNQNLNIMAENKIKACTDKKLIEGAKVYFDAKVNADKNEIFVSPDGQYFWRYQDSVFYCRSKNVIVTRITKEMLTSKKS